MSPAIGELALKLSGSWGTGRWSAVGSGFRPSQPSSRYWLLEVGVTLLLFEVGLESDLMSLSRSVLKLWQFW